ncbi:MAG: 1-(5-phosphoribosyl)-5-[(5-phosphoribosylamino)methylideneamino]imidazole-4-carboxamide isomerase [Acidimicrobiales bacterium]
MDLYPAIDLRGGRCVRLYQGDYSRETDYGADPVGVAVGFAASGARWIHVVDLDAARTGVGANRQVVADVAAAVSGRAMVQVGGGVRDRATAEALMAAGAARVVLGTAAIEEPDLVRDLAKNLPIAVGLDARSGEVAVRGWTEGGGIRLLDVLSRYEYAGVEAVVVTDIGRDGTLAGPDLEGLRAVVAATAISVIASGGVATTADLAALAALEEAGRRLGGAIVGKALHDGRFTVEEAIAACAPSG